MRLIFVVLNVLVSWEVEHKVDVRLSSEHNQFSSFMNQMGTLIKTHYMIP